MHDCAAKVMHEKYGNGDCIPEQHTLVKEGTKYVVTHYDVLFESGKTVKNIPVGELKIITPDLFKLLAKSFETVFEDDNPLTFFPAYHLESQVRLIPNLMLIGLTFCPIIFFLPQLFLEV